MRALTVSVVIMAAAGLAACATTASIPVATTQFDRTDCAARPDLAAARAPD